MATIYDVARAAGVSISTVSHVLNGTRYVSEETRARVLQAIEKLNYRPSFLARAMVRQETRTIGLIVPDNVNPFFAELARGIEDYGFEAGYNVILCNSDRNTSKEQAYLDMLISKRVDGVIYMTADVNRERLQPLLDHKIPVVTFDRDYEGIDAVLLDNLYGGYEATRHLIELGHHRIACISGPDPMTRSGDRIRGYQKALLEAGLSPDPALVVTGNWTYQSGREAAHLLFELPSPPTAIFACNDTMAIGAISYLRERGLAVPQEVSIVGFDNISLSAFTCPPLTTMVTPILELGQRLCQMLLDRINGKLSPMPQRFVIRGELLIRGSTAPAC
ncbi:MAG: LacI family DNA-binding transcriptional regulator [Anaerolineae bacterium]|nr:LacI family DNA-binding transcriptional regulator [Anaerolineae bacterium]